MRDCPEPFRIVPAAAVVWAPGSPLAPFGTVRDRSEHHHTTRPMEAVPLAVEAVPDGLRLSDWHESKRIPRTNAYGLLKLLGIKPDGRKVPGGRKPVAWLSAEQIAALDPLADRLCDGATLSKLEAELSGTVRDRSAGDALATVPNDAGLSGMVRDGSPRPVGCGPCPCSPWPADRAPSAGGSCGPGPLALNA